MSRLIKQYPYSELFHDVLECNADTIEGFEMPAFRVEFYNFQNNISDGVILFNAHARAEEERPGVFVKLVQEENYNDTPIETPEIEVDEIKFVDEIYNIVTSGQTVEDSKYMQDLVYQLGRDFALNELDNSRWCYRIEYPGFGIIKSGDEIIGTIDTVVFDKHELRLNYCVGNSDLNKVDNCVIQFNCHGRCFEVSKFEMESVSSDNEYYCTYVLSGYSGKQIDAIDLPKEEFKDLHPYSKVDAEDFIADRIAIIEGSEKKSDNPYNSFSALEL